MLSQGCKGSGPVLMRGGPPGVIGGQVTLTVAGTPEQLWPYVADTDRMDRSVGLPVVHFRHTLRRDGGEEATGEYRALGRVLARWREHPFEWIYPSRFSVRRDYVSGPLSSFAGGTELTRVAGGTRLRSFVELTPRSALLVPLIRFGLLPIGLRRAARQHRAIAAYIAGRADTPFPVLPT